MAIALSRTIATSCSNPGLVFYAYVRGFLANVFSLEFQIFDVSTPARRVVPVQVYPTVVGTRQAVNLTDCPVGDRLGTGRYVARWTPEADEPLGDHRIVWFVTREDGDAEETFEHEFGVVQDGEPVEPGTYCTISDMRDEGFTDLMASDARLYKAIRKASKFIERVTGQWFEPRFMEQKLNGRGSPFTFFGVPVIAVESVEVNSFPFDPDPDFIFSNEGIRVYNRHLSGMLEHDDRQNPKIEIFRGPRHFTRADYDAHAVDYVNLHFPKGQQNVIVRGVFGYTDPDGSPSGEVPSDIRHVCALLAARNITQLSDPDRSLDLQAFRISQERTREQSISFASPGGRAASAIYGYFTGDPEIDSILAAYMRPPGGGGV